MNIVNGLKAKARILARINQIETIISTGNRRSVKSTVPVIDVPGLLAEHNRLSKELVEIKTKLAAANVGIASKLHKMESLKSFMRFLESIPTNEGVEYQSRYGDPIEETFTCQYRQDVKNSDIVNYQNEINQLQDEVDSYNASTQI